MYITLFKKKICDFIILPARRSLGEGVSLSEDIPIYILLIFILSLSGCAKKVQESGKQKKGSVPSVVMSRQFQAEVEGIECALCAQDVVDMFKTIEGVQDADFIMSGTDYEQGCIRFVYGASDKNIDLRTLDEMLQNEGFELMSVDGLFYIEPFYHEGKQYVGFDDETAMPFCYGNNLESIKQMVRKHDAQMLFAQGKIKKNIDEGAFFFTLLS